MILRTRQRTNPKLARGIAKVMAGESGTVEHGNQGDLPRQKMAAWPTPAYLPKPFLNRPPESSRDG
jgi:hypothetical protein